MNPSQLQLDIYDFVWNKKGNAVIEAVAGSGKTTTIVNAISKIKGISRLKIVFVAFNKHISTELKGRLPAKVRSSTLHGIGLSWIIKHQGGDTPKFDQYGLGPKKILAEIIDSEIGPDFNGSNISHERRKEEMLEHCRTLNDLVKLCKLKLTTTKHGIEATAAEHGFIDLTDQDFTRIELYFKRVLKTPDLSFITFEDMIFFPAMGIVPVTKYDYVFVDECQDLNKAQQACVDRMLKEAGRFIAVGDPNQAIYGFAGADSSSFEALKAKPNTTLLRLNECFRCGKEIVRFARSIVPDIRAWHKSADGIVRYGSYKEVTSKDYVLCRVNAPLVSLCLDYIREGKSAKIRGSKIGVDLVNLVKSQNIEGRQELLQRLDQQLDNLRKSLIRSGLNEGDINNNARYVQLDEQVLTIKVIAERCATASEIINRVDKIFGKSSEGITLSSIHKAKGLEADRVFILGDALMPMSKATTDTEKQQENNLIYVAYTRAKRELIFINDYTEEYLTTKVNLQKSERLEDFLGASS